MLLQWPGEKHVRPAEPRRTTGPAAARPARFSRLLLQRRDRPGWRKEFPPWLYRFVGFIREKVAACAGGSPMPRNQARVSELSLDDATALRDFQSPEFSQLLDERSFLSSVWDL